jgi:hypothetical protein
MYKPEDSAGVLHRFYIPVIPGLRSPHRLKTKGGGKMTKKKTILVTCMVLVVALVGVLAVSSLAFAANSSGSTQSVQSAPTMNKARVMVRLLMVQDESKVDALLKRAVDAKRLDEAQAHEIKGLWTDHHSQFAAGKPLVRLLLIPNGARVQTLLGKAVDADKLEQPQADRVWHLWQAVHRG